MRRMLLALAPLLVLAVIRCSSRLVTPIGPAAAEHPVPSPPSPSGMATRITLGQTTQFTLHATDRYCAETDPEGTVLSPCERYLVTVPASGRLTVHVYWNNADSLLEVAGRVSPAGPIALGGCCSSPIDANFTVSAASEFAIFVQWGGSRSTANLPPDATQNFSLTTSFVPAATTGKKVPG